VKHTRPVGGPNYAFSKKAGLPPAVEDWITSARSFIEHPSDFQVNFAGLLQSGDAICIGSTMHEINAMLQALIASCNGMRLSALQLTRYLGNHFNYWAGGEFGQARYPRSALRLILNETFRDLGIVFPKPPKQESAEASNELAANAETLAA
jgi:hypothetical protein